MRTTTRNTEVHNKRSRVSSVLKREGLEDNFLTILLTLSTILSTNRQTDKEEAPCLEAAMLEARSLLPPRKSALMLLMWALFVTLEMTAWGVKVVKTLSSSSISAS